MSLCSVIIRIIKMTKNILRHCKIETTDVLKATNIINIIALNFDL